MPERPGFVHRKMRGFVTPKELAHELGVKPASLPRMKGIPAEVPRRPGEHRRWHDTIRLRTFIYTRNEKKALSKAATQAKQPRQTPKQAVSTTARLKIPNEVIATSTWARYASRNLAKFDEATRHAILWELKPVWDLVEKLAEYYRARSQVGL